MNLRRCFFLLCGCALLSMKSAAADTPRQLMMRGLQSYEAGDYEAARQAFEQAARAAQDTKLDTGVAHYNEANALLRLGEADRAADKYMDAVRSTDLALQAKSYFNRGNALYHMAEYAQATGDLDTALQALEQALAMYENTMALDPGDRDSKINYELTLHKQEEAKELQEQQQESKQDDEQDQDRDSEEEQPPDDQSDPSDQPDQPDPDSDDSSEQQDQQEETQEEPRADEMTPEEARVLLDAMRQEEQAARERYRMLHGTPGPVDKDW